jgi:hypothetical protein
MYSLFLAVVGFGAPQGTSTDACAAMVPAVLGQELAQRFHDARLPLTTDSPSARRKVPGEGGSTCPLIARADFNGDGRSDFVLILPKKAAPGYRLIVAVDSPGGFKVNGLESSNAPVVNLFVDVAKPGTYSHTDAYAFKPSPGAVENIANDCAGFWFGELEAAADVYFIKKGRWLRVHAVD